MKEYGLKEAREKLAQLIETELPFAITKFGKIVAYVMKSPPVITSSNNPTELIQKAKEIKEKIKVETKADPTQKPVNNPPDMKPEGNFLGYRLLKVPSSGKLVYIPNFKDWNGTDYNPKYTPYMPTPIGLTTIEYNELITNKPLKTQTKLCKHGHPINLCKLGCTKPL